MWSVDTPETLRWEASDPDEVSGFLVEVSVDGGATWRRVGDAMLAGHVREAAFRSPCGPAGADYLVRVRALEVAGGEAPVAQVLAGAHMRLAPRQRRIVRAREQLHRAHLCACGQWGAQRDLQRVLLAARAPLGGEPDLRPPAGRQGYHGGNAVEAALRGG